MKLTKKLISIFLLSTVLLTMGSLSAAAANLQGGISWSYDDSTRALTISGQGMLPDYTAESAWEVPWAALSGHVDILRIEEGITRIGDWAFLPLISLEPGGGIKTLYLPGSVTQIGEGAFEFFFDLSDVYYGESAEAWERLIKNVDGEFLERASVHPLSEQTHSFSPGEDAAYSSAWKNAYRAVLEDARQNGSGLGDSDSELHSYTLYDIDKDDTPELVLHFGTSTAGALGRVYGYSGDGATLLKEFGYGGNFFATYPEGNGVLFAHARMGGQSVKLWMLLNDRIIESEALFTETLEGGRLQYTDISDIISGATNLTEFPGDTLYPIDCYEEWASDLSPIKHSANQEARFPQNDPDFYKHVLEDLTPVVPCMVSAEYDYLWRDWFSAGNTCSSVVKAAVSASAMYRTVPENILSTGSQVLRYSDLNRDGQLEAVCSYLLPLNDQEYLQFSVILSEQSGEVYAYTLMSTAVTDIDPYGVLYYYFRDPMFSVDVHTEYAFRLYFDRDYAFSARVPFEQYGGSRMTKAG